MTPTLSQFAPADQASGVVRAPRRPATLPVKTIGRGECSELVVLDMSTTGLMVSTAASLELGEEVEIQFPDLCSEKLSVVWGDDDRYGLKFLTPVTSAMVASVLLRSPHARITRNGAEVLDPADGLVTKLPVAVRAWSIIGASAVLWSLIGIAALAVS